jgi:hypothetical protein
LLSANKDTVKRINDQDAPAPKRVQVDVVDASVPEDAEAE